MSEDVVFRGKQKPSARDPFLHRAYLNKRGGRQRTEYQKEESRFRHLKRLERKEDGESVKRIRTYQSDVAGALKKKKHPSYKWCSPNRKKTRYCRGSVPKTAKKSCSYHCVSRACLSRRLLRRFCGVALCNESKAGGKKTARIFPLFLRLSLPR